MAWISEFNHDDFSPYAYISSQINLLYWQQSQRETALVDLKEANEKEKWVSLLKEMTQIQAASLERLQEFPPIKSNHLQVLNGINLDVAKYKYEQYSNFSMASEKYWEEWDTHSIERIKEELAFDHKTLSRMANMVDYTDPEFRARVLIYRLLDLLVLLLDRLKDSEESFGDFTTALKTYNRSDTEEEADLKAAELIQFDRESIEDWNEKFLARTKTNFKKAIFGGEQENRGRNQLNGLTVEVFRSLTEIYSSLQQLAIKLPENSFSNELEENDWEEIMIVMESVSESFDKFAETQLDRAIFLASVLEPPVNLP